jgi:methionyl-tRNA formyltransferase
MRRLNIVFMGTPEFAVASLDALYNSNHKVSAVVTVADKPAGRGQQIQMSAVKKYAVEHTYFCFATCAIKRRVLSSGITKLPGRHIRHCCIQNAARSRMEHATNGFN